MFRKICMIIFSCFSILYSQDSCRTIIDNIEMSGSCKGILKHGKFIGYYQNGMPAWEVHFKDDKLHGRFTHYYPNGTIHFSGSYKDGMLHSSFEQYNQDNEVLYASFKKGVLHHWLYTFRDGQKIQALKYYYGKLVERKYFDNLQ